jgi:DMSO/TMAO reductase YedYZ molybdopterin-dependent catalytic subunit
VRPSLSRRSLLRAGAAGTFGTFGTVAVGTVGTAVPSYAGAPFILKPLPAGWFTDFGTNAEMRWDSVSWRDPLTDQARLFVRNHTSTPAIDRDAWRLRVFGTGLATPRVEADALSLSYADLRALPVSSVTAIHECTGNGRSFFASQQGTPAAGTAWRLGAVGAVTWEGVRLRDVLARIGVSPSAVSIQATGLDPDYVTGGVSYGAVRRPFSVDKAFDDALLAWGMNGEPLLPDHGYPLRLVLPGWVGIGSIKWLGSLEVADTELTSPWNTKWYRMTGGAYPAGSPPLTVNPVRSAWELPWQATLAARPEIELTGRSWSGAGEIAHVDVSTDGGTTWRPARPFRLGHQEAWTQWRHVWTAPTRGDHVLMARATDRAGRTQPLVTPYNDNGYFFDAVVRHPVTVA